MPKLIKHKNRFERTTKRIMTKQSVWVCSCGYEILKKDAELSGYASGSRGFHVHCPECGRVVAQFVDPK